MTSGFGFADFPRHAARTHPDRPAVIDGDRTVSWRAFNERVNRFANGLLGLGLRPGDAVAALMPSRIEMLEAYWATAKAGLVFIPLNAMLQPDEIGPILDLAAVRCVLVDAALRGQVAAARCRVVVAGGDAGAEGADDPDSLDGLCAAASPAEPSDRIDPEAICTIMFSSGTTSRPKGIVNTQRARAAACHIYVAEFGLTFESRTLLVTPLYHNSALILALPTMAVGGCVVLERRFDPAGLVAAWRRHAATHALLVPTQLRRMLDEPAACGPLPDSTRCVVSVGEPLPEAVRRRTLERLTPRLYTMYGISEGLAAVLRPEAQATHGGSVGTPVLHTEIRIIDDDGMPLPPDTVGEVTGRSVRMMSGYFMDDAATARALRGGWLHTGDLGRLDADGVLTIVGRKKDMIISGGVNIYPVDIEQVAARHPDVAEAAVVGLPDEAWGECVKLVVAPRPGAALSVAALGAWCRDRLAGYQRPRVIEIRAALPRNATGKVLKQELLSPPRIATDVAKEANA